MSGITCEINELPITLGPRRYHIIRNCHFPSMYRTCYDPVDHRVHMFINTVSGRIRPDGTTQYATGDTEQEAIEVPSNYWITITSPQLTSARDIALHTSPQWLVQNSTRNSTIGYEQDWSVTSTIGYIAATLTVLESSNCADFIPFVRAPPADQAGGIVLYCTGHPEAHLLHPERDVWRQIRAFAVITDSDDDVSPAR